MRAVTMIGSVCFVALPGCFEGQPRQPAPQKATAEPKLIIRPAPVVKGKTVEGWIASYGQGDAIERRQAVAVLGEMTADAENPDQPDAAKAGAAAVAALAKALQDQDREVRLAAAHTLGKAGPAARAANAELRKVRDADPEPSVREAAKRALEKTDAVPGAKQPGVFDKVVD